MPMPYRTSTARRPRPARALLGALALLLGLAAPAAAVTVSPMALMIDARTRTGTLTLYNPGTLPEEITISFGFGYPKADSAGNVGVQILDSVPAGEPSAVEWMRAFPRRLVLQPGQRQVVRVMVQPPADLADGEYWSRILVSSRGGLPPIEQTQGEMRLQLSVETVLVLAANYRKGDVSTGVEIRSATAARRGDAVEGRVEFARTGNAAYLGTLRAEVLDARGQVVASTSEDLAVYRTLPRRVEVPLPAGVTGPLRLRIDVQTERDDLPRAAVLPASGVTRTLDVAP